MSFKPREVSITVLRISVNEKPPYRNKPSNEALHGALESKAHCIKPTVMFSRLEEIIYANSESCMRFVLSILALVIRTYFKRGQRLLHQVQGSFAGAPEILQRTAVSDEGLTRDCALDDMQNGKLQDFGFVFDVTKGRRSLFVMFRPSTIKLLHTFDRKADFFHLKVLKLDMKTDTRKHSTNRKTDTFDRFVETNENASRCFQSHLALNADLDVAYSGIESRSALFCKMKYWASRSSSR